MVKMPDELFDLVVDAAVETLEDVGRSLVDPGGFIASNEPASLFGSTTRQIGRSVCQQWEQGSAFTIAPDSWYSAYCDEYLGNENRPKGEGQTVPRFTGGQCSKLYRIDWTNDSGGSGVERNVLGPISIRSVNESGADPCSFPRKGEQLVDAGGTAVAGAVRYTGENGSVSLCGASYPGVRPPGSFTSIQVTTEDGSPDTCGDPPGGNYQPRQPNPQPPPPGWGDTNITIETNVGDYEISVTLNPDGSITFESGDNTTTVNPFEPEKPSKVKAANPIDGANSGGSGGQGSEVDAFGDPPDGEEWVGAFILITASPVGVSPIPASVPRDVFPGVFGNACLLTDDDTVHTTQAQLRQRGTLLLEADRGLTITGAFVNVNPSYNYVVIPLSRPIPGE